jgi:hypothetical protein
MKIYFIVLKAGRSQIKVMAAFYFLHDTVDTGFKCGRRPRSLHHSFYNDLIPLLRAESS